MKNIILLAAAGSTLLLAAGCNKNASMENQSTNAPAAPQPAMMNTNSTAGAETVNTVPTAGAVTNSAGMGTNQPATTNGMNTTNSMNTTTNMTPP